MKASSPLLMIGQKRDVINDTIRAIRLVIPDVDYGFSPKTEPLGLIHKDHHSHPWDGRSPYAGSFRLDRIAINGDLRFGDFDVSFVRNQDRHAEARAVGSNHVGAVTDEAESVNTPYDRLVRTGRDRDMFANQHTEVVRAIAD